MSFIAKRFNSLNISGTAIRESAFVLGSNLVKVFLGFLIALALARALAPADFGVLSLVMNLVLIISSLSDLGLTSSFVRLYIKKENSGPETATQFRENVFLLRLLLSAGTALFCMVVLPIFSDDLLGVHVSGGLLRVGAVVIFTDSTFNFLIAMYQADRRFETMSVLGVAANMLRVVFLVLIFVLGVMNVETVILTVVIAFFAVGVWGLLRDPSMLPAKHLHRAASVVPELAFWGKWLLFAAAANTLYMKLDTSMLGFFGVPSAAVGSYALGASFASVITVLQTAMIGLLLPRLSAMTTADALVRYRRRGLALVLVFLPVLILFVFVGYEVIGHWYGVRYPEAALVFVLLAATASVSLLATPFSLVWISVDKPQIMALDNAFGVVGLLLAGVLLIPIGGVIGCAIAVLITRIVAETGAVTVVTLFARRQFNA